MKRPHERMLTFNKHILNPIMLKVAGVAPGPFAVVHHIGRRSGKAYATPIIVRPVAGGFVIALTYGPQVDWYRNVQAGGRATLNRHGKEYAIENPEPLKTETALPVFPMPLRTILRLRGTQDFVKVRARRTAPTA